MTVQDGHFEDVDPGLPLGVQIDIQDLIPSAPMDMCTEHLHSNSVHQFDQRIPHFSSSVGAHAIT